MPGPRADFVCDGEHGCQEAFVSLPVSVTACLECGQPLRRIWAPVPTISGATKLVDKVVGPEYERNQARRKQYDPGFTSQPQHATAGLGSVDQEGRFWSQMRGMGTLEGLKELGGPRPLPYRG